MKAHLNPEISTEIQHAVTGLPLYLEGPGVDYTNAEVAYAANITLLHDPTMERGGRTGLHIPTKDTEALVVRRGSGDGKSGSWGGVSGYVDTIGDFDPVARTVHAELTEECNLSPDEIEMIELFLGKRFEEDRRNGGRLHVLPLVGVCVDQKPCVRVDGHELTDHQWVPLGSVSVIEGISSSYVRRTLPHALGGLGLRATAIRELLH